ncbi:pimeloyl-ACP methyl ester carboxylesterase [Friedmanniella endophytica]|uniref:Pimeloyl-ACP methyl ester carboxylesterase n=1 Tax=Microlunatus kandeliicorticis TaxID=1759536 RepID=A0A7W3P7L7_9ACTN|nr:alpha/beta fold hydrolase [Microlunatus kandeliicorticis]MBA8794855.1 pimeloyl-ACP methyl ester carboxylesterase [Microlunatus kandeliicorticis]MBA8796261.1 pimeloyl-ACP methyl ester carboxylesterase [Microlunatus kandeliicorticis]
MTTTPSATPEPTSTGYLDLDDLHLFHAVWEPTGEPGERPSGGPVVLLHGGMLSIDLAWAELIPALRRRHRVIAPELQGHGRTNDTGRSVTPAASAGDVVALLDHLGIDRAHVVGHSMGAAVALELAVSHGDRLLSVVPISGSVRPDGMHADLSDSAAFATSTRMPTADDFAGMQQTYRRLSPHPDHFDDFLATLSASNADLVGWSDEQLAGISAPVLVVQGDHDFVTVAHGELMTQLIPGAQLAVLPGTTHMQATHRTDLLVPLLERFLD